MNRKRVELASFLTVVLAGAALAQTPPPSERPPMPAEERPGVRPTSPALNDLPVVTVLDAGSGEKKQLRYTFTKGTEAGMKMIATMSMTMSMNGQAMPAQKMPPTTSTITSKVTEVDANGNAHCEYSIDAGAMGGKSSGNVVLTNRGQVTDKSEENQMASFCVQLPDEAVGAGAKWQVKETIKQMGMTLDQTSTYTLKGFNGDSLDMAIEVEQSAAEQDVEMQGTKMHLKSLKSQGSGTASGTLNSLFPTTSETTLHTATSMNVPNMGDMDQAMDITMKTELLPTVATKGPAVKPAEVKPAPGE